MQKENGKKQINQANVKRGLASNVNVLSLLKAIVSQIFVKRIERSFTSFFMVCWGGSAFLIFF